MKVWQITEAPDSGFTAGKKTPGGVMVPDNFDMKKAPLKVSKSGELQLRLKDGTVLKNKSPAQLVEALEKLDTPNKPKVGKWREKAGRYLKGFTRVGLIQLALVGQGLLILKRYTEDVGAFKELWAATYPVGHPLALGSTYYQVSADATLKPLQYSAFAAAGAVMAVELARLIKLGKITRIIRFINAATAPLVAVPIWGWVIKAIIFALTEGAIWAAGWTIQRYGPDLFHYLLSNTAEDVFDDLKGIVKNPPPAADSDKTKIKNAIKKELDAQQNGSVPKPPSTSLAPKNDDGIDYDSITLPD
jgi:hypothetical protein